jgi:biopolymer transport protein ExbD
MRIRDAQAEPEEPFNLVPLMDMAFNLLIFFMAATSFTQLEKDMRVQLPRTAPMQAASTMPSKPLIINIRQDGATVVDGKPVGQADLAKLVAAQARSEPGRPVLIRADERSVMKYFANVATLCRRAGVSELRIGLVQGK